jgi:NAD(P)-dependent dehydrogenase (short-subunit alcohol dehydrogenase family)
MVTKSTRTARPRSVVAGATRGAGRGIAAALGEAGATVVCLIAVLEQVGPNMTVLKQSKRRLNSSPASAVRVPQLQLIIWKPIKWKVWLSRFGKSTAI